MVKQINALFAVQGRILRAPDDSPAERKALKERAALVRKLTLAQRRKATVIAAAILHLWIALAAVGTIMAAAPAAIFDDILAPELAGRA